MEKMWIDANHLSYIGIGGKNQNGDSVIDKIKRVYEILKPYQAIHTKYKKYEKQINSKYWGIFMDISQAITIILKFIPGAEVVGNIISQIRKIIHWGTEFIQLKDQNIRQEVTPLMAAQDGKSLTMVVGEIIEQLKQAWAGEEEEQVIEFEEEQVIEF
jgi:Trk K+ transport system NAD-binding subunit